MKTLDSRLDQVEAAFDGVRDIMYQFHFTLGGNWEYDHGFFDRSLDEANKVWLRVPFQVTFGTLDGDKEETDAVVRLGKPFVLKHEYREGLDQSAEAETAGALIDQFQAPSDPDAEVEPQWMDKASGVLREVEQTWLH